MEGPTTFTSEEVQQLKMAFEDIGQENLQLRRLNSAMGLAIYRKRLQLVHEEHADGSVSFDLISHVPDFDPVIEPVMN